LNNTQTDVFDFNLRARATFFDLLRHGSELRVDLSIGSTLPPGFEYFKKLGGTNFFVAPNAAAEKSKTGLFSNGSQIAQYETKRTDVGIDFGYESGSRSEFRLGYSIGHADASVQIGDPVLPDVSGKRSVAQMQWIFDDTDSPVVPNKGLRTLTQARWIFDTPNPTGANFDTELPQFNTRIASFIPMGKKNTIILLGEGDTSFSYEPAPAEQFTLGGLFRVSGLARDELRGNHVLYGSIGYLRKVGQLPPLIGEKISAGIWLETGSAFDDWNDKTFKESVSVGLIVETLIGPIFTGGSWASGGRGNFYFAIGRFF
jgi:NTE family protein